MNRTIDEVGRIVIPREMRSKLGINANDLLEISLKGDTIVLTKVNSDKLSNQQKIDKAINELTTLYQIIGEQPSENVDNDNWLLGKIESIQNILGRNNE